ncbi:hypothetical protein L2E82_05266 [Cichorium intybus]|uniref:Uncharacterized protein n=1 Tax=Cichorium intybus TaxID=13427 RepID=A0ACB9H719_CICIN|nr:hypothetical protein L2E82_05266 [Cichorium intybus]
MAMVRRLFLLITWSIYAEVNGKEIGVVRRRWHLWRRFYDLYLGISPGIMELVQKLKGSGKTVYLISGGFRQMINPVASGGKPTAIELIRKTHEYKTVIMIGEGATDLEARKPGCVDLFICYSGVQLRCAFKSGLASV